MGVEILLYAERPTRRSRPLRGSYGHGAGLAAVLSKLPYGQGRSGRIDLYRDTAFNEQDADAARAEVPALAALAATPGERDAVRDLDLMLTDCAATAGSWLLFGGD